MSSKEVWISHNVLEEAIEIDLRAYRLVELKGAIAEAISGFPQPNGVVIARGGQNDGRHSRMGRCPTEKRDVRGRTAHLRMIQS